MHWRIDQKTFTDSHPAFTAIWDLIRLFGIVAVGLAPYIYTTKQNNYGNAKSL